MSGKVRYGTANAVDTTRPSPSIWADCPVAEIADNPGKGFHIFEDFRGGVIGGSTLVYGQRHGLVCFTEADAVADCALQSDEKGVLMLDQDGTDDDVTSLTTGENLSGLVKITTGDQTKMWFEARFKVSTVTDTDLAVFVGLTEEGQAANGKPLGAVGAIGDIDHIGFNIKEDDGDSLDFVHTLAGQVDGGEAAIHTVVVDTYIKVGLYFDPDDDSVHVYIDGVEDKSAAVLASASNFPSGEKLAVTVAIASGAAGADGDNLKIDWFRVAQEYVA
jgi:hypothetical protein